VADFTHDELSRLDAGSWKSRAHAEERIPTLEQVLEVVSAGRVSLQIELKTPRLYPGVVTDLVYALTALPDVLRTEPTGPRVVVQSFHFAAMKDLKTRLPNLSVGLLGTPALANLPVLGTWADQVNPHHWSVDRSYVDAVHRQGMSCLVWTVDSVWAMRRAVRLGVDGVITNRPDRFGEGWPAKRERVMTGASARLLGGRSRNDGNRRTGSDPWTSRSS
jgi:glycerophosphoryl diester phosphodiesterase